MHVESRIRRTTSVLAMLAGLALCCISQVSAQGRPAGAEEEALRPGERVLHVVSQQQELSITELHSRVIELDAKIRLVDDFNQETVTVTPLNPNQIRIRAEKAGVTTVRITDEFDQVFILEIYVEKDVRELQAQIKRLFPGSAVQVVGLRDGVVLKGWVTDPTQIPQIVQVATAFYPDVQNHIEVGGGNQVLLKVKVMEVQRSKLEQYGFNFLLLGQDFFFASTPGGLAPIASSTLPFGGPPQVNVQQGALANTQAQFAILQNSTLFEGFIEALKQESLLKIHAEPQVATTSGRPAEITSGGEFPLLVPQGIGTATIQFRQFGVRMETVPIVLGNGRVQLDVFSEVSERDFANSVDVGGIRVPGLTSRTVNTRVEMNFGESLMIGGLTADRVTTATNKIPLLGDVPYLGALFSRKNHTLATTELVIMVTPHLISPIRSEQLPCGGPGLNSDNPTSCELLFGGHVEVPNFAGQGAYCPVDGQGAYGVNGYSTYDSGFGTPGETYSPAFGDPAVTAPQYPSAPGQQSGPSVPLMSPGAQGLPANYGADGFSMRRATESSGFESGGTSGPYAPAVGDYRTSSGRSAIYRDPAIQQTSGAMPWNPEGRTSGTTPGLIAPQSQFVRPTPQFVPGGTGR